MFHSTYIFLHVFCLYCQSYVFLFVFTYLSSFILTNLLSFLCFCFSIFLSYWPTFLSFFYFFHCTKNFCRSKPIVASLAALKAFAERLYSLKVKVTQNQGECCFSVQNHFFIFYCYDQAFGPSK